MSAIDKNNESLYQNKNNCLGSGIILAKHLTNREFVLPMHEEPMEEQCSQSVMQSIRRSLIQLSKVNEYHPYKYECGLYKALQNNTHYMQVKYILSVLNWITFLKIYIFLVLTLNIQILLSKLNY